MSPTSYLSGVTIKVQDLDPKDGDARYLVTQVGSEVPHFGPPSRGNGSRKEINWSFGPLSVTGFLDTDTWEIGIAVFVMGIKIGEFFGDLKKGGLAIEVDLIVASGQVRFYLNEKNELWVHFRLKILLDGELNEDVRIWPLTT